MYIYKTTCLITNKIYIGQCNKLPYKSNSYIGSGNAILNAIQKYGKQNFTKEILKDNIQTQKELDTWEQIFIKKFDSTNQKIGYNILSGTSNGFGSGSPMLIKSVSERQANSRRKTMASNNGVIICEKISKSIKNFYDSPSGQIVKNKLSFLMKKRHEEKSIKYASLRGEENPLFGKKLSTETKLNMSINRKGKFTGEDNHFFGKTHSEETLAKMRKPRAKRRKSLIHKK